MPGPGQKNVTISEEIWNKAYKEAEKENPENPSVAGWITKLIQENVKEATEENQEPTGEEGPS